MHPRIRRLNSDYRSVQERFGDHPHINLISCEGTPPEKYTFGFFIRGLTVQGDDETMITTTHRAEVFLPLDYPRRPPFCRMITPVFHPNIDPQKICIGDHWSAGQSLDELVIRIAQMICFQSYNIKSPLNAKAAAWASENIAGLPLDNADLNGGEP